MDSTNSREQHSYAPSSEVYCQTLAGEAVLLDVATGIYFGLDEVGTKIWELLSEGQTIDGIMATLADEYDVDRSALERDTQDFVGGLLAKGLVQTRCDLT